MAASSQATIFNLSLHHLIQTDPFTPAFVSIQEHASDCSQVTVMTVHQLIRRLARSKSSREKKRDCIFFSRFLF